MKPVICLRCDFRHKDNGNCTAVGGFCTAVPAAHCPLLRQYLDTGMTPEAFQSFVVFFQDLIGNQKASEALDRGRQLVKADRAGRLVVLPCKVGQRVFALLDTDKHISECEVKQIGIGNKIGFIGLEPIGARGREYGVALNGFGKTVFLTRKEAEEALEAMQ